MGQPKRSSTSMCDRSRREQHMSSVDASIVLVTKNGAAFLDDVLLRVRAQVGAERVEIVAIDSGSTDATLPILVRRGVRLKRIPAASFSHSGTRQMALELAHPSAKYIVYLSQDAAPADECWLGGLLSPFGYRHRGGRRVQPHHAATGLQPVARPAHSGGSARLRQATNRWARCQ